MTTVNPSLIRDPSVHETQARARKATLIALVLARAGVSADVAARLDDNGRNAVAGLAQVAAPSDTTWAAVIGALEALDQAQVPA